MNIPLSFAREGRLYYLGSFLLALVCLFAGVHVLALIAFLFSLFSLFFFRDPVRHPTANPGQCLSPADGTVLHINHQASHPLFSDECVQICIFMSVLNVHFNRVPTSGFVEKIIYRKGSFFPAYQDEARLSNEQNEVWISSDWGSYPIIQIAGILARRIRCYITEGEILTSGQKIGLIQFGSRVDIYLPSSFQCDVQVGSKVKAGLTVLGSFSAAGRTSTPAEVGSKETENE